MNNGSTDVSMNIILRSIVSRVESYTVLTTKPADWDTNWMSYFIAVYVPMNTKPEYFDPTKYFKYVGGSYIAGSPSDTWDSIIWYDRRYQAITSATKPDFVSGSYFEGSLDLIRDGENIGESFGKINELIDHVDSLEKTTIRGSELAAVATSGSYDDLTDKPMISGTTAFWTEHSSIISELDKIYVYTDYDEDDNQKPIPGFKRGDGVSYVNSLPFIAGTITQAMIQSWNNKVAVRLAGEDNDILEFYK